MIGEIRDLLGKHGPLTLRELAGHFKMAPDALEPMLQLLVRKGQVRLVYLGCSTAESCDGCACTSREDSIVFELAKPQ